MNQLKDESFQFKFNIQIPKYTGGTRPLTIALPKDKLVQECMIMVLEAVF
jgi:retron-type reverse transcriptase